MSRSDDYFFEDWRTVCPFYRKEGPIEIRCAGLIGTHTTEMFANGAAKKYHKDNFCNSIYNGCPIFISHLENGEGEG